MGTRRQKHRAPDHHLFNSHHSQRLWGQRIHWTCQHRLKPSLEPWGEDKKKKKEHKLKNGKETWKWTANLTPYG